MLRKSLVPLFAVLAAACAGGGQATSSGDAAPAAGDVVMVVVNQQLSTVSVSLAWQSGRTIRLGEVRAGATRSFNTPSRGDAVALRVEVLGAVPTGTTRGGGGALNDELPQTPFVLVGEGDQIEWTIQASGSIFQRRLGG